MRQSLTRLFSAVTNALLFACFLTTQALPQNGPAFRANVEIVVVPFAVVDANGSPVGHLSRDEFRVYADEVRRPIENLWVDDDLPLTLGILIDSSESQEDRVSEHRQTAIELLQRILRPGDQFFVVSVNQDVRLWADLTKASAALRVQMPDHPGAPLGNPCTNPEHSTDGLRPISACGASPLWDAVFSSSQLKLRFLTGSKALLLLTDGFDGGSLHSWRQAAEAANRADASVYAIQYRSAFGRSYAPDLYRLVTEAGGTWFPPPAGRYGEIVSRFETDLRQRYVVGFRPDPLSSKTRHDIRIEVSRPNLTVRARKTYFEALQ